MLQWIFSERSSNLLEMTQCMVAEPRLSRNLSDSAAHGNLSAAFCCCLSHQAAAWTRLELCCPVRMLPVPLEASAILLLSHAFKFCLLGSVAGWVSVSYFLTLSTYLPGTPTPSRALLRPVAPLSTASSCPRSSCSSFIFSYRSVWSGSLFNFQRNFLKTLICSKLHPSTPTFSL